MKTFRYVALLLSLVLVGCLSKQSIQIGSVAMPHQARSTTDPWQLVYQEHVKYPQPFRSLPQIQLSLQSIEAYTRRQGTFYQLTSTNVTAEGFELKIYGAYMESFSNCIVNWAAIGDQ